MTVSSTTQARNEIMSLLKAAWDADTTSCEFPMLYWDTAQKTPTEGAWARATMQHGSGGQATLSNEVGARRFRYTGAVTVQLFTPTGDGLVLSDQLVQVVKNAFAGVTTNPGNIHLRNVRSQEIGQDGVWFNTNVLADFEYDEVR